MLNRKAITALTILLTLTGCAGGPPFTSQSTYYVHGHDVKNTPENYSAIGFNNSTIQNSKPIQNAVREAAKNNSKGEVKVNKKTYNKVRDKFDRLPIYTTSTGEEYLYIKYNGTVVAVGHQSYLPGG